MLSGDAENPTNSEEDDIQILEPPSEDPALCAAGKKNFLQLLSTKELKKNGTKS